MQVGLSYLVAAFFLRIGEACMNNTEYFGILNASLEITGSTLLGPATSCRCCGLCHQNAACKSFSFGLDRKECTFYSKVGTYGEFSRQRPEEHRTQFFFIPERSLTNEFCRSDSDCVTPGDSCRGRICTTDTTVTCRHIHEQNSALPDHRYWGFVDGRELRLYCRMENGFNGATMLLAFQYPPTEGVLWTADNRLNKTFYEMDGYPDELRDFSILGISDSIRDSSDNPTYEVRILAKANGPQEEVLQTFTAPKTLSLVGSETVPVSDGVFTAVPEMRDDRLFLAFPHLPPADCDNILYTTNSPPCKNFRAMVKASGRAWWPVKEQRETIIMYITE